MMLVSLIITLIVLIIHAAVRRACGKRHGHGGINSSRRQQASKINGNDSRETSIDKPHHDQRVLDDAGSNGRT